MMQVICPGCAKLIEVGALPAGTLPSCPFCRTVFQLPRPAPRVATPAAPLSNSPSAGELAAQQVASARGDEPGLEQPPPAERQRNPWRALTWVFVVVLFFGGLLATILVLAVTLLENRDKQQNKPKSAVAAWQRVSEFSGRGRMQTQRFRVDSPVWRMKWSCQANQTPAKKSFQVHVMDNLGKLVGTPISAQGDDGETTVMETEPGTYFLVIQATNVRWELTVEHQP